MKRDDLQAIRALAIISVLLFHFFPGVFPNGYLGVDQFFVLSGFLMTMIFGSKPVDFSSSKNFYYRRMKRIVPLYLLILVAVIIMVPFVFPPTFFAVNIESLFYAAAFIKNMGQRSDDNDYFVQLAQADDLFTHTWSLAAEIQFYVFVPLLFFLSQKLENKYLWAGYWGLVSGSSFAYHLLADSTTSFNSVFCRIWQFCIGIFAYFIQDYINSSPQCNESAKNLLDNCDDEDDEFVMASKKDRRHFSVFFKLISSIVLCFLMFFPFEMPATSVRSLTTIFTGCLITAGGIHHEKNNFNENGYWSPLVYLGNISYTLYLIHWPIYIWIKYEYPDHYLVYIAAMISCVILSAVINETFEKCYLTWSSAAIVSFIGLMYIILYLVYVKGEHFTRWLNAPTVSIHGKYLGHNYTREDVLAINKDFLKNEYPNLVTGNCFPNKTEHGFCEFQDPKQTGKLKFMILGNSYAANQAAVIHRYFKKFSSRFAKFSRSRCDPWASADKECNKILKEHWKQVSAYNPDVLFVVSRHFPQTLESPIKSSNIYDDPVVSQALKSLEIFKTHTKRKIFILGPMPTISAVAFHLLRDELKGGPKYKTPSYNQTFYNAETRLEALIQRCKICELFDYQSVLMNKNGNPTFFEPSTKLLYFTWGGMHLTPAGLEAIEPVLQRLAKNFEIEYGRYKL